MSALNAPGVSEHNSSSVPFSPYWIENLTGCASTIARRDANAQVVVVVCRRSEAMEFATLTEGDDVRRVDACLVGDSTLTPPPPSTQSAGGPLRAHTQDKSAALLDWHPLPRSRPLPLRVGAQRSAKAVIADKHSLLVRSRRRLRNAAHWRPQLRFRPDAASLDPIAMDIVGEVDLSSIFPLGN